MLHDFSALHDYRRQLAHADLSAGLAPEHLAVLKRATELSELAARAGRADMQASEDSHSEASAAGLTVAAAAAAVIAAGGMGRSVPNTAMPAAVEEDESSEPGARPTHAPRAALAAALAGATGAAAAARTPPPAQSGSGLGRDYMDNVLEAASKFVFIDHAHMNWHEILASEFADTNKSPFTVNGMPAWPNNSGPRVAVIGAGASGLLTAWELAKVGMRVTVFEGNPAPTGALGTQPGGGRMYPVLLDPAAPNTRVELGCMRFPQTSYLFWHYVTRFGVHAVDDNPLVEFPNAGRVPSLFSRRDSRIYGMWSQGGTVLPTDVSDVAMRQILKFINYVPARPADAINTDATGVTAGQIAELMLDQSKLGSAATLTMVRAWWNWAARDLGQRSYETFLRQAPDAFSDADVELAGDIGFGMGGFWPLFPTSALDLMRLVLWSYNYEFQLPELHKLPQKMVQACKARGVAFNFGSEVKGYYHVGSTGKHAVLHGSEPKAVQGFDFVVCATSFKVARALLDSSLANKSIAAAKLGNSTLVVPYLDNAARPGYASAFQVGDFGNQGISSVKLFSTIAGPATMPNYLKVRPVSNPNGYHAHVGTFFGASKTGVTYHLPKDGQLLGTATGAIGLNYSWNAQAESYYAGWLKNDPLVGPALNAKGIFIGTDPNGAFAAKIAHSVSELRSGTGDAGSIANWNNAYGVFGGFSDAWKKGANNPSRWGIVYWNNVPWSKMGFKLDFPNFGKWSIYSFQSAALSHIAYRNGAPEFGAWDAAYGNFSVPGDFPYMRKSRTTAGVYFAGESFSHYGGWVEGAMQSALSNAMALYYAAVRGTNNDVVYGGGDVTTTAAWKGLFGQIEAARRLGTSHALIK
jgi:hypothetical protein